MLPGLQVSEIRRLCISIFISFIVYFVHPSFFKSVGVRYSPSSMLSSGIDNRTILLLLHMARYGSSHVSIELPPTIPNCLEMTVRMHQRQF